MQVDGKVWRILQRNEYGANSSQGVRLARELLHAINELGLPCGCEFLDTIMPQVYSR